MVNFLFSKKERHFQIIIESIDKLCNSINNTSLPNNGNKRKQEIIATKNLIETLYPNTTLTYNSYGAPELSNNKAFSLSHSNDFLAIITSENTAAIDIEKISSKAFRVQSKFLHEEEFSLVQNYEDATVLWCAKECLFKIHQKGNLIFSKDLRIHKVNYPMIECSILGKFYRLNYEKFNGLCVVYYFD